MQFAVTDPCYIPSQRYTSVELFELERSRLWPRAWQMACRLEEVPAVGDFVEYTICDESILVVRTAPDSVAAYFNACRHRATQLGVGSGHFGGGQITCPFHGWRWHLDGRNCHVHGETGFDPRCLEPSDLALRSCRTATWGGCVFVNPDPSAAPLEEALAPVSALLDPLGVDRMQVRWWKSVILQANWKLAQEAFMEAFHVPQTHPQLTLGGAADDSPEAQEYFVHPGGHSHFQNRPKRSTGDGGEVARRGGPRTVDPVEMVIASSRLLCEGLDAMTLPRDLEAIEALRERSDLAAGSKSVGAAVVEAVYDHAARAGVAMPQPDPSVISRWGGMFFLFPNYFILPQYANALIYRSRPNGSDPESCLFELWSVTLPAGDPAPSRPLCEGPFRPDDAEAWPTIPLQDFSNIERQQRGLHTAGLDHLRLSSRYEAGIANMHQELDRYLAAEPSPEQPV
ncbi:MAG: aromatic ring-hydroxylating oxygenase subunit alpha [Acidimicrobiales bacterium]